MGRRIITELEAQRVEASGGTPPTYNLADDWLERIVKTLPTESITIWLLFETILKISSNDYFNFKIGLFSLLLLATIASAWYSTKEPPATNQIEKLGRWLQISNMVLLFPVWVYCIGSLFDIIGWYDPVTAAVLLVLFTFVGPAFIPRVLELFRSYNQGSSRSA